MKTFTIDPRFRGPKDTGNGGYSAGLFAAQTGLNPVCVTLRAPPPLGAPLLAQTTDKGYVALLKDGELVAQASAGEVEVELPPIPSFEDAKHASAEHYLCKDDHTFPECFVCGTERDEGDGLRIFPGRIPGSKVVASLWTPSSTLPHVDGVLAPEIVWAALDCPGAFACLGDTLRPVVLGRMCSDLKRELRVGEELLVLGWPVRTDGRKEYVGTAILSRDGELLACSSATWIAIAADHPSITVAPR